MDYTKCINCNSPKPPLADREEDCFLYCSKKCKVEKDEKALERRLKQKETHSPWDRMTEAEREMQRRLLKTSGPVVWDDATFAAASVESGGEPKKRADGKVDGRSKGMRKCGKCGETGHNARTCGEHGKKTVSLASAMAARARAKAAENASESDSDKKDDVRVEKKTEWNREAIRASKKPQRKKRKKEKKGSRKCGKCGETGHNARTCIAAELERLSRAVKRKSQGV